MSEPTERLNAALSDRYKIERQLGQGGMATVYLAEDLKHDRKVALKVLKPELAAVLGAERFVQEIKTTAALQHPHILPLFDSGSADGFLFYVMPYIEGETLRDKLNRETQLSIDEAVRITTEVADALDYAHRHGVIHRDIKPENILLHDGRPMVADFGIALALSAAAGGRMTETGMSLGTPHYMSPEQATADKDITARSDVYSLASVLYEMLTGNPPHVGSSAQQIIMKIIAEPVQLVTTLRKSVPPNVAAALSKALEKLPADRFDTAKAFADALANPSFRTEVGLAAGSGTAIAPSRRTALVGAALLAVGLVGGYVLHRPHTPAADAVRFTLPTSGAVEFETLLLGPRLALSPDGRSIIFTGHDSGSRVTRLYRRSLDQLDATPIQGTDDALTPFVSPDGRWIGFVTADNRLRKVPADGGPPVTVVDSGVSSVVSSPSWGDDHRIVFRVRGGYHLKTVSDNGGRVEDIGPTDSAGAGAGALYPSFLPDGAVLFELCHTRCHDHDLAILNPNTGRVTIAIKGAGRGWYLPAGYLVYATDDRTLNAVPFDAKTHKVTGSAVPLLQNVAGAPAFAGFAVSAAGTMVYAAGGVAGEESLALVDRSGKQRILVTGRSHYQSPRFSPDGERIAVTASQSSLLPQIWTYDIPSATLSQLTFDGRNIRSSWSPDGTRLTFGTDRNGSWDVWWAPADGSSKGERVAEGGDVNGGMATSWTRDGKWIVFDGVPDTVADSTATGVTEDVFAVPTTGTRKMRLAVGTDAADEEGEVSPDGRWIAWTATRSGASHVYVTPFLRAGGRTLVSAGHGTESAWISDTELTYLDGDDDSLTIATLAFDPAPRVVRREALFDFSPYEHGGRSERDYDVTRDGKEFLVVRPTGQTSVRLIVTLHWLDALEHTMATQ